MKLEVRKLRLPLSDFTLEIDARIDSTRTAIFGPSGAGKTSFLETIAGLRRAQCDLIQFNDITFADQTSSLLVRQRQVGYVPQDDSLFPHFDVRRNLLYGRRLSSTNSPFSFHHVVGFLRIEPFLNRSVRDLSRGERQRVTIGRALLSAPRLLLLDEPLTGLDDQLRVAILEQLRILPDEFNLPILYVTHDRKEAIELCDEAIVLERGRIVARGVPAEVLGAR